ncbi:hypothetical protein HK104_000450 [Borealophlyctis nickersoniae]|nr:hypothetical protein HK104_000450 [Borealophlyctis nickersoniae]
MASRTSNKRPTPPTTTPGPTLMDTDATTTHNNKGTGNNRGSQCPVKCPVDVCKRTYRTARDLEQHLKSGIHNRHRCPVCVCKRTFRTARDLEQHRNSGIHDDHLGACAFCQRTFHTFSGVTQHLEDGNCLTRAHVKQSEKPTTARDLEQHLDSGIHNGHSVTCACGQRIFRTLSGVTSHLEDGNCLALARAQVKQLEKPTTATPAKVNHQVPTCPDKIASDRKDSVLHSSTILVLRLGINMTVGKLAELAKDGIIESCSPFICATSLIYNLYYKRFAHIVFKSPAAATRAQKAIDGLVVDGRKLVCDKVPDRAYVNIPRTLPRTLPDQAYGNIPPTLSVRPVAYGNPTTFVYSSYDTPRNVASKSQSSRRKIVISLQKAVPAAKGVKEVIIDLAGDENTSNDRSGRGPPRTAPAAEHSTASASPARSNQDTDFTNTDFTSTEFTSSSDSIFAGRSKVSPSDRSPVSQGVEATPLVPELPGKASPTSSIEARTPVSYVIDLDDSSGDEKPEKDIQPIPQLESATTAAALPKREKFLEEQMKALQELPVPGDAELSLASAPKTPRRTRLTVLPDDTPADATIAGRLRQTPARMNRRGMTPVAGGADHNAENDLPSNKLESRRTRKVGAETFTPLRQRNEPEVATSRKKPTKAAAKTKKPSTRSVRSETPLQDKPKHEPMSPDDRAPATPKTKSAKSRKAEATPARTIVTRRMAKTLSGEGDPE